MRLIVRVRYPPGWKPRRYGRQDARRYRRCAPADTAAARSGGRALGKMLKAPATHLNANRLGGSMK